MTVVERTNRSVTVRMTIGRWERMQQFEKAYQVAKAIIRAKNQCVNAEPMNVKQATAFIESL